MREGAEEYDRDLVDRTIEADRRWDKNQHRKSMAPHFTLSKDYANVQPTIALHSVIGLRNRGAAKAEDLDEQDDWIHRNRHRLELTVE